MKLQYLLIALFIIAVSSVSFGQPPPPIGGGSPPCWPPPCVPIDGGVSFLIAAAALYGGKKLYDNSQDKS